MMNFSDIKSNSRKQLEGKWLRTALVELVVFLIMTVLYKAINGLLSQILMIPILASVTALFFRIANNQGLDFKKLTLTKSEYIRFFIFKILIGAIQFLIIAVAIFLMTGGLMFQMVSSGTGNIIANIYDFVDITIMIGVVLLWLIMTVLLTYIEMLYTMTPYIIFRKNEDIDAISAMRYSRELIKGYKWNLFLFELSFIGWGILAVLTLGIGFLFLAPYYEVSIANYYLELVKIKKEYAREKGIIDRENETFYRSFVEESNCPEINNDIDTSDSIDKKENNITESPMDSLTVEKLTSIEGYENKDEK